MLFHRSTVVFPKLRVHPTKQEYRKVHKASNGGQIVDFLYLMGFYKRLKYSGLCEVSTEMRVGPYHKNVNSPSMLALSSLSNTVFYILKQQVLKNRT